MCVYILCRKFSLFFLANVSQLQILLFPDWRRSRTSPMLFAKEASSDLIGIGEAIQANATPAEVTALLKVTLFQEFYPRNSCLHMLQVSLRFVWHTCFFDEISRFDFGLVARAVDCLS